MRAILLLTALVGLITVCAAKLDIVFVIDGSSSVCNGSPQPCKAWTDGLQLIYNIVDKWTIGENDFKVGLVKFGTDATVEWDLSGHSNKNTLLEAILKVVFPGGELGAVGLVKTAVDGAFSVGDRLLVANAVVIISNGAPIITVEVATAASLTLQTAGKPIYAVCVQDGGCTADLAKALAANPKELDKEYFLANTYADLGQVEPKLLLQLNAI
jgi:hypothetical protein